VRLAAAVALCAGTLFGQGQSLQIVAPSVRVTAGDNMTLSSVQLEPNGSFTIPTPRWTVDNPAIATVDSSGKLTGITLGVVKVTATFASLTHDVLIQVVPDHVALDPPSAQLLIGEQVQFTAKVFDKNGKALTGVPFAWTITTSVDDGTPSVPYGAISPGGMLTGMYEGNAYVRALYTYTSPIGGVLAGMETRIPMYAPFVTSAPRPFRLQRLFNARTQQRQSPALRPRPSLLWSAPDGRLLFNASLDGLGASLVSWDESGFQPIAEAGTPSQAAPSIVTDLGRHSLSLNGGLMVQQSTTDGNSVLLGTVDNLQPLLINNIPAAGEENITGFNMTRNSLSSGGYFVFTGSFRIPGTQVFVNGIFRGQGRAVNEVLFSQADTAPELGVSNVSVGDFGVDNNGVAWYLASLPGKATMFRHDADGRKKFLQIGDPLLGSTLRGFLGSRNSTPASLFAENGDVIFGVQLNDNSLYLLRYTGTDPARPAATLRVDNTTVALAYVNGTVLLYGNPRPNQGDGAWLWKSDGSLQAVALVGRTRVNGQNITSIESGAIDAKGRVTLMVATAANPMVVIRATDGDPQVLFQAGDTVAVTAPTVLNGFVPGGRRGNPLLFTGSATNPSISELRDGDVRPVVFLGDQVLGGSVFTGFSTAVAQRTANGDLYAVVPGVGIGRYQNGQWDPALKFPIKVDDGASANVPFRIAVSNSGVMVWATGTDKGDTRVYRTQDGQHQLLCSNGLFTRDGAVFDGIGVFSCDDFFVDDTGRVLLRVHLQNETIQRSYVWNQGTWTLAVQPFRTQVSGRTVTNVNLIRALGSRLSAILATDAGNFITEWTDSGWTRLVQGIDLQPVGFRLTNLANQMELNPSGDMLFMGQGPPSQILFFDQGGKIVTVLNTGRRTDDGDFLVNIQGLDVREDGTIYVMALNERDEQVLYSATPIGN
jgi:hypothetical protein